MKKKKIFSLVAAALSIGFVACNNDADSTADTDTTATMENTATTSQTTTTDYSALADTFRTNSEAGNYLDARTGKPIRITVDPQTGVRTNVETGEPVWRYVDRRTWWVYSDDNDDMYWDTVGTARMESNRIMYRGDNDNWTTYDEVWAAEDEKRMNEWKTKVQKDGDIKSTDGHTTIKTDKDGDTKVKTEDGQKIKIKKDGTVKDKSDN